MLRLVESRYDFSQGVAVISEQAPVNAFDRATVRTNWNSLREFAAAIAQAVVWSDFTPFAESAADFAVPLGRLKSHIPLMRQSETHWDSAFQLYSSLLCWRL
jgi:hypothetical protein